MAGIGDFLKSDVAKGLAIGIGVAVTVPIAMAAMSGAGRPFARALVKSGMILFDKGRESIAEVGEVIEDMVAEAKAEMQHNEPPSVATAEDVISDTKETKPGSGA
jgi:hypothetical protein